MIDVCELKRVLNYNPDTGEFTWRISPSRNVPAGALAGYHSKNYVRIRISGREYSGHQLAWLYTHGEIPDLIDHINQDKHDNRLANLRPANKSLNMANSAKTWGAVKLKGVSRGKGGRYVAQICHQGKRMWLGEHPTPEAAHAAYKAKAKELFGEYAHVL